MSPTTRKYSGGLLAQSFAITFAALLLLAANDGAAVVETGPEGKLCQPMLLWAGYVLAFGSLYIVCRRFQPQFDRILLATIALLAGLGLVLVWRLNPDLVWKQLIAVVLGSVAASLIVAFEIWRPVQRFKYVVGSVALLLLILTLLLGIEAGGARAWIRILSWQFQPSELVKLLAVIFVAAYLQDSGEILDDVRGRILGIRLPNRRYSGPLLAMWVLFMLVLVIERDLGTAFLFYGVFIGMLYAATCGSALVQFGLVLGAAGSVLGYLTFDHVKTRVLAWVDPWADPMGKGFQIMQSLFALAEGGFTGTGLGNGDPGRIPAAPTDFVYAVIGEELGLLGTLAVLLLYLVLVERAFRTAARLNDRFASGLAAGIGLLWGFQAFLILGGVTRLIPVTGVTLPFVSLGGSSMVVGLMGAGLLLSVSGCPGEPGRSGTRPALRKLFAWICAGYVAVGLATGYWQIVRADELKADPRNPRTVARESLVKRGSIYDSKGRLLASTQTTGGRSVRVYNVPPSLSHTVGYVDKRLGKSGIEKYYDEYLLGRKPAWFRLPFLMDEDRKGNDIVLTIDWNTQIAGQTALGGRRGAVVAIEPDTGALRALVSTPGFDLNAVAKDWESLSRRKDGVLLNRALSGQYPPGSSIKPLILAAAFDSGVVGPGQMIEDPGFVVVDGYRLSNAGERANGTIGLVEALAVSSNVTFAKVAIDLGGERFDKYARAFGLGTVPDVGISALGGRWPSPEGMTDGQLAEIGIGQGQLLVTPLQMAVVAATLANGGVRPTPYLVESVVRDGRTRSLKPSWKPVNDPSRVVSRRTADYVGRAMREVVRVGTGKNASIPGIPVAGKTGTAENPHGLPHSWFIGFAPAGSPELAVAVVVENGGAGGVAAAEVARTVLMAYLNYGGNSKAGSDE